jgi:hydrogenase/urease accessory protein HupE
VKRLCYTLTPFLLNPLRQGRARTPLRAAASSCIRVMKWRRGHQPREASPALAATRGANGPASIRPRLGFLFSSFFASLLAATAWAHDPGLSSAQIERADSTVAVHLAFAWTDLARLLDEAPAVRPNARGLAALAPAMANAAGAFATLSANGSVLTAPAAIFSPDSATATDVLVTLTWTGVPAVPVESSFPILSRMPFGHRTILTLGNATEPIALLDSRHATWTLAAPAPTAVSETEAAIAPAQTPPPEHISWTSFIPLGIEHILTGYDHLCFLLALLLMTVRFREVLGVVTTFTVAHSITLALAATGVVSLPSSIVEPLIAASIVYIGVENLVLKRQPRYRLVLVFGFGLIHGLGFASALAERLPGVTGWAVVPPLISFNLGVETGQLMVAACLVPLIRWARTRPDFYAGRLQPALSLVVAIAGMVWFLQRTWLA